MNDRPKTAHTLLTRLPTPPARISGEGTGAAAPLTLLCEDSRRACAGALFVCIKGARSDGHAYLPAAYAAGCRAFLVETPPACPLPPDADVYLSDDTRRDLALLACDYYGHPSHGMTVVGITGTKGKTTTAMMCYQILEQLGHPVGYIGTAGIWYGRVRFSTRNTTPDALTLQGTLADMRQEGVRTVFLEVSSQALWQKRVEGTRFALAALTNLSHDHIGPTEHPDFAHYAAAKRRLLTDFAPAAVAVWTDDPVAAPLADNIPGETLRCGTDADCDLRLCEVTPARVNGFPGIYFVCRHREQLTPVTLPMPGLHNAANALLSLALVGRLGVTIPDAAAALCCISIPGRYDMLRVKDALTVIDYAHNGAALHAALETLRPYADGRLICLIGSVGERSQCRRADLGQAAATLADFTYLTADDPGREPVEDICADMAKEFSDPAAYTVIPDRAEAIRTALSRLAPGDILLLAGKGDEQTQRIGTVLVDHNDRAVVEDYLATALLHS